MALVEITPGTKGRQALHYEVPAQMPRRVRRLRTMVLVVGVLSLVSVLGAVPGALQVADGFTQVREALATQAEFPPFSACFQEDGSLYCPTDDPSQSVSSPAASCTRQGGQDYCSGEWADAVVFVALFKDSATIAANLAGIVLTLVVAAALYIPARYFVLWRRMARAVPSALPAVRQLAWLQVAVAFLLALVLAMVFEGTELFDGSSLATGSAGLLLAPFILWSARNPEIKHYFSAHEFKPRPASPVGVQGPPAVSDGTMPGWTETSDPPN